MTLARTEAELRAIARALARGSASARVGGAPVELASLEEKIKTGADPLGDAFCEIRSPDVRRSSGATYTPSAIVQAMVAWAGEQGEAPARIVDAGSGSGRYLLSAALKFPGASLIGVETDPLARELLRANARVLGVDDRLQIIGDDFRSLSLPKIDGRTLWIGNPPYVRHHDIEEHWKDWFAREAKALGFGASRLAGLHIHFFLKTRLIAAPGDFGCYITAAEWLDVNYGSVLREMLADGMGGTALHLIDPKAQPFPDAMATGAITCFHVGNRGDQFTMRMVGSLAELGTLAAGEKLPWERMTAARRWSPLISAPRERRSGFIELGELFRVNRGTVTGANPVWIAGERAAKLPSSVLFPAVTKAREIIAAGLELKSLGPLRRVIDLPVNLDVLASDERREVEKYLRWAKAQGAAITYTATHRAAWWAVGLRAPAPILSTYMGRRAPAFTLNRAKAHFLNIAHGLTPRDPMSAATLVAYVRYLNNGVEVEDGRTYAGGLTKFEPKELERVLIPAEDVIHELAANMDLRGAPVGRRGSEGRVSSGAAS